MRCQRRTAINKENKSRETMQRLYELTEDDIYDITPLESMGDLLNPATSLCIVHNPCWNERGYSWMRDHWNEFHIRGISNLGAEVRLEVYQGHIHDLGRYKSRLDKHLLSAFLFVSWQKRGGHTFKMVQQRELIAEFPDFDSAMVAYMPEGFTPRNINRVAHSASGLFRRYLRRRELLFTLLSLLRRRQRQLEQFSAGNASSSFRNSLKSHQTLERE